ncbi:MAG: 50S ribosomal protein L4 [Flavobacteriales bacterium]|jgi:large subunit ribosomal protein L4|nr:50S ribosomal protein L4 [Flavobacteriales bacterium]
MELAVYNKEGKATAKKVTLADSIFGLEPNEHAVYLDVKLYLANQRQGTHKAKERGEITGSTKKIKKQKGTGTARAGSIKNPLFRGGGRVFGPRPRNYSFKLNKKLRKLARATALSHKAIENQITILEDQKFDTPKTSEFVSLLENLKVSDKKTLFVVANEERNVYLSSRNLKKSKVVSADKLNTFDILNADALVLAEGAVEKIENLFNA